MSTVYKYWVFRNHLMGLIDDWSLIVYPLPDEWSVWDSETLLPGYPDEYTIEDGQLVRRPPPPPPNALERVMSTNPTVLSAIGIIRDLCPSAALLSQLIIAHIEQNLALAEEALTGLAAEVSSHSHPST